MRFYYHDLDPIVLLFLVINYHVFNRLIKSYFFNFLYQKSQFLLLIVLLINMDYVVKILDL